MENSGKIERSAGILMHISSLPSPFGIGTFGKTSYEFVDFVAQARHRYWQVLPLGPTTYGDSPYQSYSAFAGNPYFVDLEMLTDDGILDRNIYEKFDTLVFVSIDNLDKFNKVYDDMDLPHEKVINNYINCERILKLAEEKLDEQDNELFESRKKSEPTIVQVSRLVSQKAIDRLIKVHSKLIKQGYNHKIIVIGDGPLREKLEKQIQEEGVEETFKLIGARENPYPIVKKADFFCLLSNFEGYPMVVEEAKILNKFILTTNTATREALIDYAGKSHIVSNSEEGVEEALKFAVKNYKQKDKQNSQYEYKNDRIIGKIEKMIEENSKHPDRVGKII